MSIFKKKQTLFNSTENCCTEPPQSPSIVAYRYDNATDTFTIELSDGNSLTTDPISIWNYPTPSYQSFLHSGHLDTETLIPNKITGYFIEVKGTVTITEANINVTATGTLSTDVLFGIYNVANGYPKSLLCNTPVLSTATTGIKNTTIVGGYQILEKGIYFVAYSSNSDAVLLACGKNAPIHLPGHLNTFDINSFITGISANYNYTGTLPTTFPAGGSGLYADIPMAIFKI